MSAREGPLRRRQHKWKPARESCTPTTHHTLDSIGTPIYLSTSPPLNYIANLIIAVNIQSCAPSNVSKGLRAVDM
jgi:hypothetical protein